MAVRVLVVDDDAELRGLLRELLEGVGYAVTAAGEGEQLPGLLSAEHFDAVVCDQRLGGGLQGTTLLQGARDDGLLKRTACILMSGLPPASVPAWLEVVPKPFELRTLVAALQRAVRTTLPEPRPVPFDRRSGRARVHELNDELLETQLDVTLRARISRELTTRRSRLGRTVLALELGKATRRAGELLREEIYDAVVTRPEGEGVEATEALLRLEADAAHQRERLDGLTIIAHRLGVSC